MLTSRIRWSWPRFRQTIPALGERLVANAGMGGVIIRAIQSVHPKQRCPFLYINFRAKGCAQAGDFSLISNEYIFPFR